jgi:NADPH:quinone reductase-like Zn-dependent oxidoreductase
MKLYCLKPMMDDEVFGFNKAVHAAKYVQSQRHFGKVVIRID